MKATELLNFHSLIEGAAIEEPAQVQGAKSV